MLNPSLDVAAMRAALARDGRAQVSDFLDDAVAVRLRRCLVEQVPWTLAVRDAAGVRTISAGEYAAQSRADIAALLADAAAGPGFRFAYDSYMMVRAYKEGRDPGLDLHSLLESLNSPPAVAFYRAVTGDTTIRRASAQATRYRPGHFLRRHDDFDAEEGRRYAYVINLTREWQADWGGLLQFIGADGRVLETFLPRWNTISVFRVPAMHAVSLVAPWAAEDRLAITGWWSS